MFRKSLLQVFEALGICAACLPMAVWRSAFINTVQKQPEAYPSCPNSRPENKKPSTGDALTDLNSGITRTVAAQNVKKSRPKGTKGSGAAEAVTFLLARLER